MSQTRAGEVSRQKLNTSKAIVVALLANNEKVKALKSAGTTGSSLETMYKQRDTLLDLLAIKQVMRLNNLNSHPRIGGVITELKRATKSANAEARRLQEATDSVAKFTELVNDITGIVSSLTELAA